MHKFLLFFFCCTLFQGLKAQLGLRLAYGSVENELWETIPPNCDCLAAERNFKSVGIDYSFRLKQKRLEFFPALVYHVTESFGFTGLGQNRNHTSSFRLELNTQVYPLDFGSDCDCPTWSNSNDFFKKAFFLFVAPSVGLRNHISSTPDAQILYTNQGLIFAISTGMGIDIALSKHFTISPLLRFAYTAPSTWNRLNNDSDVSDDTIAYGVELRFGISW